MTPLVVDSSVVVKWFVTESLAAKAHSIYADYQAGLYTFLAPDFLNAEMGNVVWKKHIRQDLSADEAQEVIDLFRLVQFQLTSTADLLDVAYKLAVRYQLLYVALAQRENCAFVTADEKLVNALRSSFDNVIWLANWA